MVQMLARHSSPRRRPLSAPRGKLRAAYRLAAGLSPAAVARAEAVAEREITGLLARPDFQAVMTALRDLQDLSEEERLRRLEGHAWQVLELARPREHPRPYDPVGAAMRRAAATHAHHRGLRGHPGPGAGRAARRRHRRLVRRAGARRPLRRRGAISGSSSRPVRRAAPSGRGFPRPGAPDGGAAPALPPA